VPQLANELVSEPILPCLISQAKQGFSKQSQSKQKVFKPTFSFFYYCQVVKINQ
jgi:hypothetical protein